ncbi:MAG TPA: MFS transporter [Burkholderiales bacterium]|nr:MFS transporter [Burkholderiales bacterium]
MTCQKRASQPGATGLSLLPLCADGQPSFPFPGPMSGARANAVAVIALSTAAQVASVTASSVFPVIAPELASHLGVEPSFVGYQVSLIYGTAMLASPFMGALVPRVGAARATQIGLAAGMAAMLLAMSSGLFAFAAASVLVGLGLSVMPAASSHLLFRFTAPESRNLIFSLKQTGIPLGWMLMAAVAPAIALGAGWRWALAAVLALLLVTAAVMQPWRARWDDDRGTQAAGRQSVLEGLRLVWRYPALRRLSVMSACYTFVQLCVVSFAVTMLVTEAGYSLVAAGFLLSLTHVMGVAGRVLWGWVADATRDGPRVLAALGLAMSACCLAMAFVSAAWPAWALVALFAAFGLTGVAWNGIFLAEAARSAPRGQVSGAVGGAMVWNFGGVLAGPALFATAYGWIGSYALGFGALAGVGLAGVALLLVRGPRAGGAPI